jgi:glycosyltransferase involved in cell wall biosynthesis
MENDIMRAALLHFCFEDYTIELANALADFVDLTLIQPHKVAQACAGMLDPRIQVRQFYKPRIRDPRNFWAMVEMMRIIRDLQPDLLHVQETNDFWYDLTLLFNRMPPLVTTIHDIFRHPGDRQTAPGAEYTRLVGLYRSQQVIVHTQSIQKVLTNQFRLPPQRVKVLAHGELGGLYHRRAALPQAPLRREPHTLLFFGRIWPYKGLKYLLQALPLVAQQIPDVKLIIAGRGEELQQYFPQEYDTNRYEIHNEFIPVEAVAGLFQRSAVTVLPYIEASQSGVAALSYGMGTPVIASNVSGLGEMVRHGQDGLLVPPQNAEALAEALIQVLTRPDLQAQMQAAALERCRQDLSWRAIAAQTVELYYQVSGLTRQPVAQAQGC